MSLNPDTVVATWLLLAGKKAELSQVRLVAATLGLPADGRRPAGPLPMGGA